MKKTETETIIIFNMQEKDAWVETFMPSVKTRFHKLGANLDISDDGRASGPFPACWLKIGPRRKVSEKQKLLASERMKKRHRTKTSQRERKK